jgi:hypothetical protein
MKCFVSARSLAQPVADCWIWEKLTMSDEAPEVPSNNAVPSGALTLVELWS